MRFSRSEFRALGAANHPTPRSGGGGAAPGLVSLQQPIRQQQDSRPVLPFSDENHLEIDVHLSRLKRMKSRVLTGTRLHTEQAQAGGFRSKWAMVTLTYRPGVKWAPGHFEAFATSVRNWMARRGHKMRSVMVAELQQRGVVHYHVLVLLPKGLTLPKPDKQGWWPHGSTRIEWARCAGGYLAKYASKGDTGFFPKGCRICSVSGLAGAYLQLARWWSKPKYVREAFPDAAQRVVPVRGGGWMNTTTGEVVRSAWEFAGFPRKGVLLLRRKCQHVGDTVKGLETGHGGRYDVLHGRSA